MTRLLTAALLVTLVLVTIKVLSCAGNKPRLLVDATAVICAPVQLPNPCDVTDCNRVDPRSLT